jgi:hypothetical protein
MDESFDLRARALDRIWRKTGGKLQLDAYSDIESTAVLVDHVTGLIGNGGIRGLLCDEFDDDPGYGRTIRAFREIGSTRAASLLEESIRLWNSVDHPKLDDPRFLITDDYLDDDHPQVSRRLTAIDDEFIGLEDDTFKKLGEFISLNYL